MVEKAQAVAHALGVPCSRLANTWLSCAEWCSHECEHGTPSARATILAVQRSEAGLQPRCL